MEQSHQKLLVAEFLWKLFFKHYYTILRHKNKRQQHIAFVTLRLQMYVCLVSIVLLNITKQNTTR